MAQQTTGATKAGGAPFLAQTNPIYSQPTYVANTPLVTTLPISGEPHDGNIFGWMGTLTYVLSFAEVPLLRMKLILYKTVLTNPALMDLA